MKIRIPADPPSSAAASALLTRDARLCRSMRDELRKEFEWRGLLCLHLIGAPGSGKTRVIERTLGELPTGTRAAVLLGGLATDDDLGRLSRTGAAVKAIAADGESDLDAAAVARSLRLRRVDALDLLFIENAGDVTALADLDLGQQATVIVSGVSEGDDKPEKYASAYRRAALSLVTKTDLLPYVEFDPARLRTATRRAHPGMPQILVSCRTGEGFPEWHDWLTAHRALARTRQVETA